MILRFGRLLLAFGALACLPPAAAAEDTPTGRLWDWRLSKEPARVMASVIAEPPIAEGVLLILEPTALAASFWSKLAAAPLPARLPPTLVWVAGRGATTIHCAEREDLATKLAAIRITKAVPTQPVTETLSEAMMWAKDKLPGPRSVLMVTTRFDFGRKHLEDVINVARADDMRVSVVCPEAAFSDNAQLLMRAERRGGEAPAEEVPFDWDLNLAGLWLGQVRWSPAQRDLVPADVRGDPWRGLPFVRGRGYGLVPSGFAAYPISRLAHATGGRVFLNSYRPAPKAKCTYEMDPGLYRNLAPSVQPERTYAEWRRKDPIARIYDKSLSILIQSPGLLVRDPKRGKRDGSVKGFKPLPTRFDSNGDLDGALRLAERKDGIAKKALLMLGRIDGTTGKAVDSPRFRAHCVLLMAWLQRVRFHLGQYMLTVKRLRAEDRLASQVSASIAPKVLWKFCYGIRGAAQRSLGYRPGPGVQEQQALVVESATRVGSRYRYTPWEAGSKLGFLVTYVEHYFDGRIRGPNPSRKTKNKKGPTTPPSKKPAKKGGGTTTAPTTPPPAPTPPTRPGVGGGGTGGAVTGE